MRRHIPEADRINNKQQCSKQPSGITVIKAEGKPSGRAKIHIVNGKQASVDPSVDANLQQTSTDVSYSDSVNANRTISTDTIENAKQDGQCTQGTKTIMCCKRWSKKQSCGATDIVDPEHKDAKETGDNQQLKLDGDIEHENE